MHVADLAVGSRSALRSKAGRRCRLRALQTFSLRLLRYGLVLILIGWGGLKFTAFEAKAIEPFVEHSPLLSWLYPLLGAGGTSAALGVVEITLGVLIATRRWSPRTSGFASLAAAGMFVVTLSFLFTTPGILFPPSETAGFLTKDLFLLGVSLYLAAEALLAVPELQQR
jgi:uncharacterized membrane protein YkgB